MGFGGYDGYGVRNVMWSNLYPPHPSPYYQREFPSPHGEYFHNGPIVDPAGYRWVMTYFNLSHLEKKLGISKVLFNNIET